MFILKRNASIVNDENNIINRMNFSSFEVDSKEYRSLINQLYWKIIHLDNSIKPQ